MQERGKGARLAAQIQRCGAFCEQREKTDRNKDTRRQRGGVQGRPGVKGKGSHDLRVLKRGTGEGENQWEEPRRSPGSKGTRHRGNLRGRRMPAEWRRLQE